MSSTQISSDNAADGIPMGIIDMKLEVILVPVSDVDRAKGFYQASAFGSTPTSPSARSSGSCS